MKANSLFVVMIAVVASLVVLSSARADLTTYSQSVEGMGPTAFWTFGDASSANGATAAATVGSPTYNGLYNTGIGGATSGVTLGPSSLGGGKAAQFTNGSSTTFTDQASVTATNAGLPMGYPGSSSVDRTVALWVKTTSTSAPLVDYGYALAVEDYEIYLDAGGHLGFNTYSFAPFTSAAAVNDGNWHFLAVTSMFNGSGTWTNAVTDSLYVDGSFAGSTTAMPTWTGTALGGASTNTIWGGNGGICIGGSYEGGPGFNGAMAGVAVLPTALTADQIGTLYAGGIATPEPSTFGLLVAGLLGLLAYAWRKRK